ncbi:MAG: IS200/IS605 family transposase [bacterium]
MKNNLKHARTCVYNCNYHIVFSTKYRKKILTQEIECYIKDLLQEIAKEKGFEIAVVEVGDKDHIHIFVSAHPKIAPSYIVKMIKGITARKILLKYQETRKQLWKGHLWNPSYYIETIGSISEDVIKKYIESQGKDD